MRTGKTWLAAAVIMAAAGTATAQLPSPGSTGMRYQVIGPATTPLSAPIPTFGKPPPKQSLFSRIYQSLLQLVPFAPKTNQPLQPVMPGTQQLPQPGQAAGGGSGITLPQIPPLVSGSAR